MKIRLPVIPPILALFVLCTTQLLFSQSKEEGTPVAKASQLMDQKAFSEAIQLLEYYLQNHPDDIYARRLLARAFYWTGDVNAARIQYEHAMTLNPTDVYLRIEYARMLVETSNYRHATELLEPLRRSDEVAADAEALIGILNYWQGNWTAAQQHFEEALRRNPNHVEARRNLREILLVSAPLLSLEGNYQNDTQPLDRYGVLGEFTLHVTPLQSIKIRAQQQRATVNESMRSITFIGLSRQQYWPTLRLETDLSVDYLYRSFTRGHDWTWRAGLGLRVSSKVALRVRAERASYLYTTASLSNPVMTMAMGGFLDWSESNATMGRAAYEVVRFSDGNILHRGYAWALLQVAYTSAATLNLGYGFNAQNARENRFTLVDEQMLSGIYSPYYTPTNLQIHSGLGLLRLKFSTAVEFHLNGSYGFYAIHDAPEFVRDTQGQRILRRFSSRRFYPWNLTATITSSLGSAIQLKWESIFMGTVYYDSKNFRIQLLYRFTPSE